MILITLTNPNKPINDNPLMITMITLITLRFRDDHFITMLEAEEAGLIALITLLITLEITPWSPCYHPVIYVYVSTGLIKVNISYPDSNIFETKLKSLFGLTSLSPTGDPNNPNNSNNPNNPDSNVKKSTDWYYVEFFISVILSYVSIHV